MNRLQRTAILVGLLFLISSGFSASSLIELLKAADLDYIQRSTGWTLVPVTIEGETILFYMKEKNIGSDEETNLVYFYSVIVNSDEVLPAAFYKKVAEINEKIPVGKIGVDQDGKTAYYISSFWLKQADEKVLLKELVLGVKQTRELKELLQDFVD